MFMVLSMIDQHKPKCYICNGTFENIDQLREHQQETHKEFIEYHKNRHGSSPAPGDVSVF